VRRRPPVEALKRPRRPPRRRGRLSSHGGPFRRRLRHGVRLPSPLECSCRHGSPWLRQGVGHHAGRRRPAVRYPPAEPGAEMGADRGLSTASHVVKSRRTAAAHCRTIPRIGRPRGRQPRAAGRQSLTPFSGPDYTAVLQGISPVLTVICSKSSRRSFVGSERSLHRLPFRRLDRRHGTGHRMLCVPLEAIRAVWIEPLEGALESLSALGRGAPHGKVHR
jgi:hypothetical protein